MRRAINGVIVEVPEEEAVLIRQEQKVTAEQSFLQDLRMERDGLIKTLVFLADRHRNERDGGFDTTLTNDQFKDVLAFMQELRTLPDRADVSSQTVDWPKFPASLQGVVTYLHTTDLEV